MLLYTPAMGNTIVVRGRQPGGIAGRGKWLGKIHSTSFVSGEGRGGCASGRPDSESAAGWRGAVVSGLRFRIVNRAFAMESRNENSNAAMSATIKLPNTIHSGKDRNRASRKGRLMICFMASYYTAPAKSTGRGL